MSRLNALASSATRALLAELATTPKPGLVDRENSGAHRDLTYARLEYSALALEPVFTEIATAAQGERPSLALREHLGEIGRRGERRMLVATGGCNTHRGALWALGLLVAGAVMPGNSDPAQIARRSGRLARMSDRFAPEVASHGRLASMRYGARGARGEAASGFANVLRVALPAIATGKPLADVFLRLVATIDDTCVLHRGGTAARTIARSGARAAIDAGGTSTREGTASIRALERSLLAYNASPGGCADLLAAGIFLHDIGT